MDIVHDDWAINDHLFLNEFIDLCGLTIEDCTSLHIAYATNYLKRNITVKDESNIKQLIEQEVLDEDGLARPLYALFVIDLYYRNSDVRSWDLESLQEQIYLRDWVKWKTEICGKRNKRENVFIALTNLLLYATIFNKWESSITLPEPLDIDCKIVFNAANAYATDYKSKKSTDYVIKKAFIPVLIKAIERANSVHDWKRSTFLEDFFLKEVMEQCGDELALDCISKFDSVIISLTKQRADLVQAVTSEPISESKQLTIQEIDQKLEKEIVFFRHVINSNSNPSVNFVWTYVGKISMVTKNLFIHECMPHNELLFQYMLRKLQEVYTMHYNSNTSSILAWRASRALDEFCDAKSEAIPPFIRVQCILNKPN